MSEARAVIADAPPSRIHATFMSIGVVSLIIGAILLVLGLLQGPTIKSLAPSAMYGSIFWILLTFGCFSMMLLFHTTRARFGTPILRIFEAGSSTMMLAFCLILVLILAIVFKEPLYGGWIHPVDEMVRRKSDYLNYNFFLIRQVCYFVILGVLGNALAVWTRKEEATGDKTYSDKRNNLAAPGIVIYIMVMTFFITDILMSIDPHWYSTVWGFLFTTGAALTAMALATMIAVSQRNKAPFAGVIDKLMMKDFGNILLMLVMLWAYLAFSQLLIIWSGNLPEFIGYYINRLRGNYSYLGMSLIILEFFAPFLLLLSPRLKRTPALLIPTAGLIFGVRFLDMHWVVAPYFRSALSPTFADLGILAAVGGIWFLLFSVGLRKASLVTSAHPYEVKTLTEAPNHG